MEYELGVMDKFFLLGWYTRFMETPRQGAVLDEEIDGERLKKAVEEALPLFPLFKTKIVLKNGFRMLSNDAPLPIFNEDEYEIAFTWEERPNGYPWKLCYWGNRFTFTWCHAITDGRGANQFLTEVISRYYGTVNRTEPICIDLGLEHFYDPSRKGFPEKKQPVGFGKKGLVIKDNSHAVNCHIVKLPMDELLRFAKRNDASPATVVPPLFAQALRKCMTKKMPVRCSILVDAAAPLGYETLHNSIYTKTITYIDRFDEMPIDKVLTIFRSMLNLATDEENIYKHCTENTRTLKIFTSVRTPLGVWLAGKIEMLVLSGNLSEDTGDFAFSYLGKLKFPDGIAEHVLDYTSRSWMSFGKVDIAAVDLNGTLIMNIVESYEDKSIVPTFIDILHSCGINAVETENFIYRRNKL